eukprot:7865421-Pyramimonas_sp.AAC.1
MEPIAAAEPLTLMTCNPLAVAIVRSRARLRDPRRNTPLGPGKRSGLSVQENSRERSDSLSGWPY